MKEIMVGNGLSAQVDDEDYGWLNQYKWHLGTKKCGTQYAIRHLYINGKRSTITMHQDILKTPKGMCTDHINGNGLDNQKRNIRICTPSENCMNRKPQGGTSKYKGVSLHSIGGRWKCRIKTKGKIYNLGHYDSEEEAARKYNEVASSMFGKFARLNTIEEVSI